MYTHTASHFRCSLSWIRYCTSSSVTNACMREVWLNECVSPRGRFFNAVHAVYGLWHLIRLMCTVNRKYRSTVHRNIIHKYRWSECSSDHANLCTMYANSRMNYRVNCRLDTFLVLPNWPLSTHAVVYLLDWEWKYTFPIIWGMLSAAHDTPACTTLLG